ncbi:MAG: hypothetical protein V1492_02315 [Candidatus Micrarchaeota archaeon]
MNVKLLLLTLLLFGMLFADTSSQRAASPDEFSNFIESTSNTLSREGDSFIKTGNIMATAGSSAVVSMYAAFSPGDCNPVLTTSNSGAIVGFWIIPALFALFIVSMGVAIAYMLGQFLNLQQLIIFAKDEGHQVAMTLLRVSFLIVVIYSANTWYGLATHGSQDQVYMGRTDMLDAAMAFARLMIVEITKNYSGLVLFNMAVHTLYTATLYVGTDFRSMYNFNLGPALKPFIDLVGIGLQFISLALGEWVAHVFTLCFIRKWTWAVFVPAGIFLRVFPQTRQLGEAIFMLVMALAIIYPFMFLVEYETHKLLSPYLADPLVYVQQMIASTGIFKITGMAVAIALLGGGAVMPMIMGVVALGAYDLMKNAVYYVVIMSLLLPFLNIFVTLTLAREWAKKFDVNVNYMAFLKII